MCVCVCVPTRFRIVVAARQKVECRKPLLNPILCMSKLNLYWLLSGSGDYLMSVVVILGEWWSTLTTVGMSLIYVCINVSVLSPSLL